MIDFIMPSFEIDENMYGKWKYKKVRTGKESDQVPKV